MSSFNLKYKIDLPDVMYQVDSFYKQSGFTKTVKSNSSPPSSSLTKMNRATLQNIIKLQEELLAKLNLIEARVEKLLTRSSLKKAKSQTVNKLNESKNLANNVSSSTQPNLIGQLKVTKPIDVQGVVIHADFDHKLLMVFKLIYYIRRHYGLKINACVHFHSSILTKDLTSLSEWKLFETKDKSMSRLESDLNITIIVHSFDSSQAWMNHQPYLVLNQNQESYLFGDIAIAKHLIRLLIKTFPDLVSIYPEKDKEKTELVKSIDYRLNKLQEYLFFGQKQYCLPELLKMLEMKEDQMVSLESENPNLTLDKILLFTFKS